MSKKPKARPADTIQSYLKDPDSVRGGTAMWMMLEVIRAAKEGRPPQQGAIVYWGAMFDKWLRDADDTSLDELLEVNGTSGDSPIRVAFKRDLRDMTYLDNMGLLVGAGWTVEDAATLIINHQAGGSFKTLGQGQLATPRALIDKFERDGGKEAARKNGYFGDDPDIKARRDDLLKQIPPELLPKKKPR